MGTQALRYLQRKLADKSGAEHEFEFYHEPPVPDWARRPCFCQWNYINREMLCEYQPDLTGFACACVGPVPFDVPGYPDDPCQVWKFCRERMLAGM